MAEQHQQQKEEEQHEQVNNQIRLPSNWFYSSVMLTNRLDIGEHASIGDFQIDHLEQNDQSLLTFNNLPDLELQHICHNTDASNHIYPGIVTSASSSSSSSSALSKSFQTTCLETVIPHDNVIPNRDIQIKDSVSASNIGSDIDFTYAVVNSPTSQMTYRSGMRDCNCTLQTQHGGKNDQRFNSDKPRIMLIGNNVGSNSNKKNDNIQLEKVEKVEVEDSDGGGEGAPPNVLYSHSTTNSSDKMKWDCGVRWPSAKRTGMLTSFYSVNIDAHHNSGAPDSGMTTATDIASSAGMIPTTIDTDSEHGGNTNEMMQKMEITTNTIHESEGSKDITVPKTAMQLQVESNLMDAATVTAIGTTSSPSPLPSSKVRLYEQPLSPTASLEGLSLPSIKVPIKKRLLHSSSTTLPYNNSETTNTCTNISPNTCDNLSEHRQLLPTTIASGVTVTSTAIESAFSSCYQIATTGSTGTMINEDPMPPVTTYAKLLTSSDVYGNVLSDQTVRSASNSDPVTVANGLSEAEIVNLLCRNLCDIERIVAQQRIAYSGSSAIQLPSLLSQCNDEQKSQVSYAGSVIVPDHQQQQHYHRHYHNVAVERRRSGTTESNNTRRFHPYAAATTTTTPAAPTTACCSNSITVWSPSVPSRADLKQKYLRSLAPVLYDLLTDDCESKNCQKNVDSMDCSILKNCVEPSMDSYLRSLSLLAATASLPIISNKFDHLPFNYMDYFALQQCSLLLGSALVTSTDLLKLAQSTNLLYNTAVTTPTTSSEIVLSNKIPFTNKIDQHSATNSIITGTYPQSSQQSAMLTVDNEPTC